MENNPPVRKRVIWFWISLIIVLFFSLGTPLVAPLSSGVYSVQSLINRYIFGNNLEKVVKTTLSGKSGTYAVVIKNLKTGEQYSLNAHTSFKSASLYKLWVMAETYDQIQQGKVKEDEVVADSVAALNKKFSLSPDEAELSGGSIELTVDRALNQMITISHNYSALLLSERINLGTVEDFLKDHGYTESTVNTDGPPTTTAYDIAQFFDDLYSGKLANKKYTGEMIDMLKAQQLNNKLPKDLPKNVVIAHKTGELDSVSHDAGIVYNAGGDYIIVVMSDTENPPAAEDTIGVLSKAVYDYFLQYK